MMLLLPSKIRRGEGESPVSVWIRGEGSTVLYKVVITSLERTVRPENVTTHWIC